MIANIIEEDVVCTACSDSSNQPKTGDIDLIKIEQAIRQILQAIGEDPDREGLKDTPSRVARSYQEMFAGLKEDPAMHLAKLFEQDNSEAVILRDIEFHSMCEHHLLPFIGKAHIAYLPSNGKVVGLSKLARTVETFARRPQMQERLTNQIADSLQKHLNPRGVAVLVEGEHFCMKMRGTRQDGATMVTSAFRGVLADDPDMKSIVLSLLTHPLTVQDMRDIQLAHDDFDLRYKSRKTG